MAEPADRLGDGRGWLDDAALDRIEAIASAYRKRLHEAVLQPWGSRAAALHAIALYFETQVPDQAEIGVHGGWAVSERIRDLLHAIRAVLAVHPAGAAPPLLTFDTATFRHARAVLALAGEARLLHELRELALLGQIEARADRAELTFSDPRGSMLGSLLHGADDYAEGYDSARKVPVEELRRRYEALAGIAGREQGEAQLLALSSVLAMRQALPKPRPRGPLVWGHPRDAIAGILAPQQAYREALRIEMDVFRVRSARAWPILDADVRLGSARWGEITAMFAFLYALSMHHHRLGRAAAETAGLQAGRRFQMFVPALEPVLMPTRQYAPAMGDYLVDTSSAAVVALAADLCGIAPEAAAAILDACVLRSLPKDKPALHNSVHSGLIEIGRGRLLLAPTLGLNAADPDVLLRLAQALDPLRYDAVVGKALGDAPARFAAELLRDKPELKVVIDLKLKQKSGPLTDIDLGIYDLRDKLLVLMEFKSFWLQDAETARSIDERLQKAAGQLTRIVDRLREEGADGIGRLLGVPVPEMPGLYPVIVMRRHYGFASGVPYPVLPQPALRRLLRRSEGRMARFRDLVAAIGPRAVLTAHSWHRAEIDGQRWRSPAGAVSPGLFEVG
ncbi:hypothetical protein AB4Z01_26305 [Inquilinus sp. YAF38]|uniref:hypothetical protein n=1 Tax=Inquilinus sp. YAF38 TaxID=3233084 RepID=UPI003F92065C